MTLVMPLATSFFSWIVWNEVPSSVCECVCNECSRCGVLWTPLIYMFWKYNQLSHRRPQIFHHLSNWFLSRSTIHLRRNAANKNVFWLLYWLWNGLIFPQTQTTVPPIPERQQWYIFIWDMIAYTCAYFTFSVPFISCNVAVTRVLRDTPLEPALLQ